MTVFKHTISISVEATGNKLFPKSGVRARPVLHIFKAFGFKNMLVPLSVRASGSVPTWKYLFREHHTSGKGNSSYFASYQSLPIWQSVSSSTLSDAAAFISSSRISLAFSASCCGASIRSSSWI